MIPANTEVYMHLVELKNYLDKDLEKIHELSEKAEEIEIAMAMKGTTTMRDGSADMSYRDRVPWPPIARCTIPQAMALLSLTDYIGYLINDTGRQYFQTEQNIFGFFDLAALYGISNGVSQNQIRLLNRCARQGMMHNFFPKEGLDISYHSFNPFGQLFFVHAKSGRLTLNVIELKRIVTTVFQKLLEDSREKLYKDM